MPLPHVRLIFGRLNSGVLIDLKIIQPTLGAQDDPRGPRPVRL